MSAASPDIVIDTQRTDQTVAVGAAVGRCCRPADVIALQGELGAGKTQFVRGLAEGLGIDPRQVSSPTFVLVQEYEREEQVDSDICSTLVHIDAYRINSEDDLISIGWTGTGEELREHAVVAIEWATLIERSLGNDVLWVQIEHAPDGRRLTLTARGSWQTRHAAMTDALNNVGLTA